jgi:hypothetical protein
LLQRICLLFAGLILTTQAQAELIARPGFTADRRFQFGAEASAIDISTENYKAYAFRDALGKCRTTADDLKDLTKSQLDSPGSLVLQAIASLFPKFDRKEIKTVDFIFDSFGPLANIFRSFYIPQQKRNSAVIALDCSFDTQVNAPALMGHELVHHINSHRNVAPWVDEMLAQYIEIQVSGLYPSARYQTLTHEVNVPSFFAREKTFKSSQEYAVNSLFGFYVAQNFGGTRTLQSFTQNVRTLADFAKNLQQTTRQSREFDWLARYQDPKALIRHFSLALNINLPSQNSTLFQVPGWQGFDKSNLITVPGTFVIEPGGSLRLDTRWAKLLDTIPENSALEAYRVLKTKSQFHIQMANDPIQGSWDENFLVLINTSTADYLEVQLK